MAEEKKVLPLATAQSDSRDEFQHLTEPYQHELLVHCYRMLGSFEDAEDALQETLLRAWRRLDSLKAQASLRAWLYRIATNVALDMIDRRKARSMPPLTHAPADPHQPLSAPIIDPIWLDPLAEVYLDEQSLTPEARYEARESVTLAFLAALQKLPGRQRAILILRDVLGWKAQEVAELLNLSVVAINSALQRARATMKKHHHDQAFHTVAQADNPQTAALLARYVHAWETADPVSLILLLHEEAILTMPPLPTWYRGRAAIKMFLESYLFAGPAPARFRLATTRANGCPAFAVYRPDENGDYRPAAFHILRLEQDQIVQIDDFLALDDRLFSQLKLPLTG